MMKNVSVALEVPLSVRFLDLGVNFVQTCHMGCRIQILEIRLIIKIMHIVAHKF